MPFFRDIAKAFIMTLVFGLCVIYIYSYIQAQLLPQPTTLPFASHAPLDTVMSPHPTKQMTKTTTLSDVIEEALIGATSTYGIVVTHVSTKESYTQNDHMIFEPASLYKLWVMAAVYDRLDKGLLTKDEVLEQTIPVLNAKFGIASESAERVEGVVRMRVDEALEQMIVVSDNYAALLLSEKIGNSMVQAWLDENGFTESMLGSPPKTTPSDIARFFDLLFEGKVVNQVYSQEMIGLLKKQAINHKLPKYLRKETVIAHKTGELGLYTHDAGIVYTDKGKYIIVILSQGNNPEGAEERIARISRAVFLYFDMKD